MTVLPIVARELRVAARRKGTYWVRAGAALAVIIAGAWFFFMMQRSPPNEVAKVLFGLLTGSATLFCLLSGVRATADTLSEEKREGTLGLLFLTDLRGYDVVLGKLAATSLNELYAVLAVLPMLAVPLLLGGVTVGEFGRMAIVALNTLFFSLTLGLFVSSISRSARKAMGVTFLLLLVITAGSPALGAWLSYELHLRELELFCALPSPGCSYFLAWDQTYKGSKDAFAESLGVVHGMGWLFLAMACVAARRSWQDKPAGVQGLRWRERWRLWAHGNHRQRLEFRRRRLDRNAFYWLAARARLKPVQVWAALGLVAIGWTWGWVKTGSDWFNPGMYAATVVIINLILKSWFAAEVGRQLAEDRKSGALELLLTTALTVKDVTHGQMLALWRQFGGPIFAMIFIALVFMCAPVLRLWPGPEDLDYEERGAWVACWIAGLVVFLVDLAALFWIGLWQALVSRQPNRASGASYARVVVVPSLLFAIVCSLRALVSMNGGSDPSWKFFAGWWFGLGLLMDLIFGGLARRRLMSEFRSLASQRFRPSPGFWKRMFGGGATSSVG